jgi:N-carbamoylputrescine amidase
MICYDGLFPESWLCRRQLSAELVLWPTNRGHYHDTNVPALARLFQVSVMAVNRFGQSSYWTEGDSTIVDAQGNVLAHAYNGEAVLIADLDIEGLRRWRAEQPQSRDRRPDLYGPILQDAPGPIAPGIPSNRIAPLWRRKEEK